FILVAVILLPLLWCIIRLEPVRDWEVKDVLSLIASPRNWWELQQLLKLERSHSPGEERVAVDKLATIKPHFSQDALLESLKSPDFLVRSRAMAALRSVKLEKKAQEALIKEVEENTFTTAYIAAEILGEQKIREAVYALRNALDSEDVYLQGKSMVSLVQLNDTDSFDRICAIFNGSSNPRVVIHGAMALSGMQIVENISCMLPRVCEEQLPLKVRQEVLQRCADLAGCSNVFYYFQKMYRSDKESALQYVREELKEDYRHFLDAFHQGSWNLNDIIRGLAEEQRQEDRTPLQQAVISALNSISSLPNPAPPEVFVDTVLLLYSHG
ncbi:MAG: HEAT repeat domain-containing protein, partial [Verrucomicrobiota bacterium]